MFFTKEHTNCLFSSYFHLVKAGILLKAGEKSNHVTGPLTGPPNRSIFHVTGPSNRSIALLGHAVLSGIIYIHCESVVSRGTLLLWRASDRHALLCNATGCMHHCLSSGQAVLEISIQSQSHWFLLSPFHILHSYKEAWPCNTKWLWPADDQDWVLAHLHSPWPVFNAVAQIEKLSHHINLPVDLLLTYISHTL